MARITKRLPNALLVALQAAAFSLAAGCSIWHFEGGAEFCFDTFDDCMDDANSQGERNACEQDRDDCLEACDGGDGWDDDGDDLPGDGDGDGDTGDGDGDGDTGDGDGDGDGDTGDGDGDGDGDGEVPPVCIDLYQNCIDQAETLLEIDACEALFDQCANPPECENDCDVCPDPALEECLDGYGLCIGDAGTQAEVDACEAEFDVCAADTNPECLPDYSEEDLEQCLEQHGLCVACAEDEEQFQQCQQIFDDCINPE